MVAHFKRINSSEKISNLFGGTAANLPGAPNNATYTGYWRNVGTGTVTNPTGAFVLTSGQLMAQFDGATMADTFVWQPR